MVPRAVITLKLNKYKPSNKGRFSDPTISLFMDQKWILMDCEVGERYDDTL